ncbi:MAG: hypothetical protein O3A51_02290 [Verrucomicrobia bacterium]|nr:hypothetical protein [Verrucomicrobiota bacterium]
MAAVMLLLAFGASQGRAAFVNFEGKQTNPIRLSPGAERLFAVNTPDGRLSVFDLTDPSYPVLIAEIPVGIEPGSVNPRTADEAWVVNEVSDSVSIVSVASGTIMRTLRVKDEPADVVFAQGRAFVSAARRNAIAVFDATNWMPIVTIPVQGESPRAMAVSLDGTEIFAAFALSGNGTTLIPEGPAPPQPPPTVITDPPPPVGLIVAATNPAWSGVIQYTMPDHDVVAISATDSNAIRYLSRVGTVNLGLAVHPANGDLYVANTEALNLTRFEPNLRGRFVLNRLSCVATNGSIRHHDLNPGVDYNVMPNPVAQSNALAQPTAVVVDPVTHNLYVAAFGSDRVACVDTNGAILARIEVGPTTGSLADPRHKRGPRGLALHAAARRLYVLNRLANTLSIIDLTSHSVIAEMPIGSHDPTPPVVREGRGFLYDARLSGNGTVSCASCHIDAEMDMIAWDLGDPGGQTQIVSTVVGGFPVDLVMHPMKGPMVTQTLRGLDGLEPLHWRGDRESFLSFNPAFDSLLGGQQLSVADMQAYKDFIETIFFQPNPNQRLDRSLPATLDGASPAAGRNTFINENYVTVPIPIRCNSCHTATPGPGSNGTIIPGLAMRSSQDTKVAHLRNLYKKLNFNNTPGAESIGGFGFVHDGSFSTLFDFLSLPVFGPFSTDTTRKENLIAFMKCFDTGTAPAVGHALTVDAISLGQPTVSNEWTTLEGQAAVTNCDLIVKGTIDGEVRSLLYDPNTQQYTSDRTGVGPFTRAQLVARAMSGDRFTPMGVPPGCGVRMGLDRNENAVLDGDELGPELRISGDLNSIVASWPTNEASYVLEWRESLSTGVWQVVTSRRLLNGGQIAVSNAIVADHGFYRLRRPW